MMKQIYKNNEQVRGLVKNTERGELQKLTEQAHSESGTASSSKDDSSRAKKRRKDNK